MTKFEGCYLTNAGLEMVNNTGIKKVEFTKAVTGSGEYGSDEDIDGLTQLKEPRQEFNLEDLAIGEDNAVSVKFRIRNDGVTEDYSFSEIGIYAKGSDGDELLYCVAYAKPENAEVIPKPDGEMPYIMAVEVETVVSRDAEVTVVYSEDRQWTKDYVSKVTLTLFPIVTKMDMYEYIKLREVENLAVGQVVIANKKVYTYVGDDCHSLGSYCKCGGGDYFNVAIPFYSVFTSLDGSANDYSIVEISSDYDNAYNVAQGFYKVFGNTGGSASDYSSSAVGYIMLESDIEPAFDYVFGNNAGGETDAGDAMGIDDVENALSTQWEGESSDDPTAMTADDVNESIETQWDGSTSGDDEAITAEEISGILS